MFGRTAAISCRNLRAPILPRAASTVFLKISPRARVNTACLLHGFLRVRRSRPCGRTPRRLISLFVKSLFAIAADSAAFPDARLEFLAGCNRSPRRLPYNATSAVSAKEFPCIAVWIKLSRPRVVSLPVRRRLRICEAIPARRSVQNRAAPRPCSARSPKFPPGANVAFFVAPRFVWFAPG